MFLFLSATRFYHSKMNRLILVSALFAMVGLAMTDSSANQFVDQIVTALTKQKNMDPLTLQEHAFHVDRKIGAIHIKGRLSNLTRNEFELVWFLLSRRRYIEEYHHCWTESHQT